MKVVSVKVSDEAKSQMQRHPDVNWSEVIRQSIMKRLAVEEMLHEGIDRKRAARALRSTAALRERSPQGWSGAEEVRRWRDLRH